MKISKWGFVIVILSIVAVYSTSSYAVSENDAKVVACYNKISKQEKSLDKRKRNSSSVKREWGRKARIILAEAKKMADNGDGNTCLDLIDKSKLMKKFGY